MNILYFVAQPQIIGGAGKVLINQAYLLKCQNHHVYLILQGDSGGENKCAYNELLEMYGLDYEFAYYPIATCMEEIDIEGSINARNNIEIIVKEFHPHLIHSSQINITVEMVSRKLCIPHLMNVYPTNDGMFRLAWKKAYPQYHSCDSIFFSQQWQRGLNILSKCIRVAYENNNRTKRNIIRDHNISNRHQYKAICIGVFSENKNQLEVIKFIEICLRYNIDVSLDLLGYNLNEYGHQCIDYVNEHNLSERIYFEGEVISVEEYLREADFLIHLSKTESYPGVIVEAMANMVPIIVYPVGGISELLSDGLNCIFAEEATGGGGFRAFARLKDKLLDGSIRQIYENAYETYVNNHSYQAVSDQLLAYYKLIIEDYELARITNNPIEEVSEYLRHIINNRYTEFTRKHVWLLYHIREMIIDRHIDECLIWGAGKNGVIALEWAEILGVSVAGFVDSNRKGQCMGYPIYDPFDKKVDMAEIIIVSVYNFEDRNTIIGILKSRRKRRNQDYLLMYNDPCLTC